MKLYTIPGACSTADHIALRWTGQPFDFEAISREDTRTAAFRAINPSGSVPALIDGGVLFIENIAILGYIADTSPHAMLLGDGSARQRAEAMRWLMFIGADMHQAFGAFFAPGAYMHDPAQHDGLQNAARMRLRGMFERADAQLQGKDWIAGFRSAADPYLYIMLRWANMFGIDLTDLQHLAAFKQRMQSDAGVRAALAAEGLQ